MESFNTFSTRVAGVSFRQDAMENVVVGHQIILKPEPDNKYDPNAVAVCLGITEEQIGYIPKDKAPSVKKLIEECVVVGCTVASVGRAGPRKPLGCVIDIELSE